jgi:hypothetical protein
MHERAALGASPYSQLDHRKSPEIFTPSPSVGRRDHHSVRSRFPTFAPCSQPLVPELEVVAPARLGDGASAPRFALLRQPSLRGLDQSGPPLPRTKLRSARSCSGTPHEHFLGLYGQHHGRRSTIRRSLLTIPTSSGASDALWWRPTGGDVVPSVMDGAVA